MKRLYLSGYWEGGGVRYLDDPNDPRVILDADWGDDGTLYVELKQHQNSMHVVRTFHNIPESKMFSYEEAKRCAGVYAEDWGFELSESTEPWED